jgi:hypothetical protein
VSAARAGIIGAALVGCQPQPVLRAAHGPGPCGVLGLDSV